jgi:Cu/Ag efflux protein CusF
MKFRYVAAAVLVAASPVAFAQANVAPAGATSSGEPATALTHGEIRKVDRDAAKLTIRHEPLANLDMPAMTMVFRVTDPKMLDAVKQGDKVEFRAEKVGGQFTVTKLEPAK